MVLSLQSPLKVKSPYHHDFCKMCPFLDLHWGKILPDVSLKPMAGTWKQWKKRNAAEIQNSCRDQAYFMLNQAEAAVQRGCGGEHDIVFFFGKV